VFITFISLFLLKEPYWLAHHQKKFETLGTSRLKHLFGPTHKIKTNVWSTFLVYIHESWTLGKPYKINLRCYLGTSWGRTWEVGEPCGNTLGTRKKPKLLPLPNVKVWTCHEGMLNFFIGYKKNFYFQNCLSPFLA
jgi:hypothetical protein